MSKKLWITLLVSLFVIGGAWASPTLAVKEFVGIQEVDLSAFADKPTIKGLTIFISYGPLFGRESIHTQGIPSTEAGTTRIRARSNSNITKVRVEYKNGEWIDYRFTKNNNVIKWIQVSTSKKGHDAPSFTWPIPGKPALADSMVDRSALVGLVVPRPMTAESVGRITYSNIDTDGNEVGESLTEDRIERARDVAKAILRNPHSSDEDILLAVTSLRLDELYLKNPVDPRIAPRRVAPDTMRRLLSPPTTSMSGYTTPRILHDETPRFVPKAGSISWRTTSRKKSVY